MGTQLYDYTRTEHEYSVNVPQLMVNDPELVIYMSAHGGGTVGESYAGNGWDYAVYEVCEGTCRCYELILEGSDLRSPAGRPAGHAEMAEALASFLSAAGEHFSYGHARYCHGECDYAGEYSPDEQEWLAANYERLSLFAIDA